MCRYISILLKEGRFRGHPYEVLGGLDQIARGAEMLRKNEVSSKKLVYRFVVDVFTCVLVLCIHTDSRIQNRGHAWYLRACYFDVHGPGN